MPVATKVCTVCGQRKTLSLFPPHPKTLDGRGSHCNPCRASAFRARKQGPEREHVLELRRQNKRLHAQLAREKRDLFKQTVEGAAELLRLGVGADEIIAAARKKAG